VECPLYCTLLNYMVYSAVCTVQLSPLCTSNSVSECDNCYSSEQFCCPSSPKPPDWTQLFARTLALRPELLDQLANISLDDDDDTEFNCSLDELLRRRAWLMEDLEHECRRHEPTCPQHVRI